MHIVKKNYKKRITKKKSPAIIFFYELAGDLRVIILSLKGEFSRSQDTTTAAKKQGYPP
jgi:hypothetical protein